MTEETEPGAACRECGAGKFLVETYDDGRECYDVSEGTWHTPEDPLGIVIAIAAECDTCGRPLGDEDLEALARSAGIRHVESLGRFLRTVPEDATKKKNGTFACECGSVDFAVDTYGNKIQDYDAESDEWGDRTYDGNKPSIIFGATCSGCGGELSEPDLGDLADAMNEIIHDEVLHGLIDGSLSRMPGDLVARR